MLKKISFTCFLFVSFHFFGQNADLSPLTVPDSLSKNADSVIRLERIMQDLTKEGYLTETIYRVVTVYNKAGIRDVNALAFYDNNTKVKNIQAAIYDLTGQEKEKFKKRDFKDISAVSSFTLYQDSRILHLDYTPTYYPFTIIFESERESKTTGFLRPWVPLANYASSTQFSEFTILYDSTLKLNAKETNLNGFDITSEKGDGWAKWTGKNIKAIKPEYNSPGFSKLVPRVKCSLDKFYLEGVPGIAGTWKEFGSWMNEKLIKDTQDLDEQTKNEIRELVVELPNDEAKARAIYQYVQDKVRYVSIQVEIGGWKPMKASDVHRLSYGDCKALSNYTQALLKAVGISSYYTVLYGGDEKLSLEEDLVAIQGNHAILGVQLEGGIKWLECTSQETPFGYMGTFTDDRDVLMITEEGGKFTRTLKYEQKDNLKQTKAEVKLSPDGSFSGNVERTSKGIYYSPRMALDHKKEKELKEYYFSIWKGINNLAVNDIILDNNRDSIVYTEKLIFESPSYASSINGDLLLKPNLFIAGSDQIPPRYTIRRTPFIIERGTIEEHYINFDLPENASVDILPDSVELSTDFGTYKASFDISESGILKYRRILSLNEGSFEAGRYEEYRDFYKQIVRYDNQKLLIKTK